jgi:hypothetical protein
MTNSCVLSAVNRFNSDVLKLQLTPLESSLSLPVPVYVNSNIYLSFLCFIGKRLGNDRKIKIFRPNSCFIITIETAKIVSYLNYTFKDQFNNASWEKPIGEFPHPEIENLNIKGFREKRNELLIKYDQIVDMYTTNKTDDLQRRDFKDLFYFLCEPCLLPYMKKIGNAFFTWLED